MNLRKIIVPVAAAVAALLLAAPAGAAPSLKDARQANVKAAHAVAASVVAARSGSGEAASMVEEARRLQARAARVSRRTGADRSAATRARLLRGAAAGVDGAFDSYAELLSEVPPELQPVIAQALEQLAELRGELIGEITAFVDEMPPDVRDHVLAAIAAFQSDGDLKALVGALTDPAVAAGVQDRLQELITNLTGMLQGQIGDFEGLEELLPPGALEQLQQAITQVQAQLENVLGMLDDIFGPDDPVDPPELPSDPAAMCSQLQALLQQFGLPVPPGFCGP